MVRASFDQEQTRYKRPDRDKNNNNYHPNATLPCFVSPANQQQQEDDKKHVASGPHLPLEQTFGDSVILLTQARENLAHDVLREHHDLVHLKLVV